MIFPAKWFYIFIVVRFEVGSVVCGAAPNFDALIVGRVIVGIGAVGIYTGALFLISVNTTEEERYNIYWIYTHCKISIYRYDGSDVGAWYRSWPGY